MANTENLDWLHRLKSEIYVYMPKEWLIPMDNALDDAIKALEREETVLQALEDVRAEITGNLETIIGKYDSNTKPKDMPSRKIERNNGRIEAIDIINRKIGRLIHGND